MCGIATAVYFPANLWETVGEPALYPVVFTARPSFEKFIDSIPHQLLIIYLRSGKFPRRWGLGVGLSVYIRRTGFKTKHISTVLTLGQRLNAQPSVCHRGGNIRGEKRDNYSCLLVRGNTSFMLLALYTFQFFVNAG